MGTESYDAALVKAACRGDRRAFDELVIRHYPLLLVMCRRSLGDALLAEDAAQEATIRAFLGIDRLRQPEQFGPWLCGIGLNICRSWLRQRVHERWSWDALYQGSRLPEPMSWAPGPEEVAEETELGERVLQAVSMLPAGQRSAVLHFYLSGRSQTETAALLGIQVGTVKTRLYKARAALRHELQALWKETSVEMSEARWVDFQVADVRRHAGVSEDASITPGTGPADRYSMVLEEVGGSRRSVWGIPRPAAEALAVTLQGTQLPYDLPHTLMSKLVQASGGRVQEIRVRLLANRVGAASIQLSGSNGEQTVDARMSDAVNLALVLGVPIRLDASMLTDSDGPDEVQQRVMTVLYAEDTVGPMEIAAQAVPGRPDPWG